MLPTKQGAVRLFRVFGISVYLHWTWLILVGLEFQLQRGYGMVWWGMLELVSIFAIVVLHEFGHALACRSVGGRADTIMLWPLGGVAYVQPPQRPGAVLWSIAAGPLVNVILVPVTLVGYYAATDWYAASVDLNVQYYALWMLRINLALLIFNMLPIYPLDGGQIVQAILWFFIGRARSLKITASLGMAAAVAGGVAAAYWGHPWLVLMAFFVGFQAFQGYRVARYLATMEQQGLHLDHLQRQPPVPPR